MIETVETVNFRKLTNSRFDFSPNLNVIRGRNEAAKSTCLESIAYALYGRVGLREPLEQVVTWGQKESTLKVKLRFKLNDTAYEIRRGKSGAELDVNGKLAVTGQDAVTAFVENLTGASAKTAAKLMLAKQSSIQGALVEGATATAQMIEQLSNFSLIDEIVALVQEKLPSGSPVQLEQQIAALDQQLEDKPGELDLTTYESQIAEKAQELAQHRSEVQGIERALPSITAAADAARDRQRSLESARGAVVAQGQVIEQATASISSLRPASACTDSQIAAWEAARAAQASAANRLVAWNTLQAVKRPEPEWDETRARFDEWSAQVRKHSVEWNKILGDLRVQIATKTAELITEQACAFCGKDLTDVPEVVKHNVEANAALKELRSQLRHAEHNVQSIADDMAAIPQVLAVDAAFQKIYARYPQYIKVLDTAVPAKFEWVGEVPTPLLDVTDYTRTIAEGRREIQRASRDAGQKQLLEEQIIKAQAKLNIAKEAVEELEAMFEDRSIMNEAAMKDKLQVHRERVSTLQAEINGLNQAVGLERRMHEAKIQAHGRVQAQHFQALAQLEQLQLNNVLLKKLRAARPYVADRLWGAVTPTIAHYFSEIRGVKSTITRDDSGFMIDGKPVTGFSGSTLDALGLAIRIALVKTFLPNIDFMILDEPASACDGEREANMLGAITMADFSQVLLVTHSEIADAFAEHMVLL